MDNSKHIIVFLLIAATLVLSRFVSPIYAMALIPVVSFGIILLGSPDRLLFVLWVWASVMQLVLKMVRGPLMFLDEILIVAVIVSYIGIKVFRRGETACERTLAKPVSLLFGWLLISAILNRVSMVYLLNVCLSYYSFPFILFMASRYSSGRNCILYMKCAFLFFFLQVALNMGWKLGVNPLPNQHVEAGFYLDIFHGSIGGANWVAYLSVSLLFLFASIIRTFKASAWRSVAIFSIPVCLLQIMYCYTAHVYAYFIPCVFAYIVVVSRKVIAAFKWMAVLGVVVLLFTALASVPRESSGRFSSQEAISGQFSKTNLQARWHRFVFAPKMQLIDTVTKEWAKNSPLRWIAGLGPSNGTSAIGMIRVTPGAYELLAPFYLTETGRQERIGNSILESTYSGLVSIWSEIGIVGYSIFMFLHIFVLWHVISHLRRQEYSNMYQRVLAETFVPAMVMYLAASLLIDAFGEKFWNIPIWIMAGFVWDPIKEKISYMGISHGEK